MHLPGILLRLFECRHGSAAVEMVLVVPLLTGLLFGALELGRYFLDEHALIKAVRDGARFAARQNFSDMPCTGQPSPAKVTAIRNLVRFGNVAGSGNPRIRYWRTNSTIAVSVTCTAGDWSGIYRKSLQGAPVVTVSAAVPYVPLVGTLGLSTPALQLRAQAQSAVMGR